MESELAVKLLQSPGQRKAQGKYTINEIFYSLQGEGVRAGIPHVFIRMSGCNLQCVKETHGFDCDTEFVSGASYSADQIVARVRELGQECRWVLITGGEPLLQLDLSLCRVLKESGYSIALETNGSIDPSQEILQCLDWISCSPKVAEHAVRLSRCDELRYVRSVGQGIPRPRLDCKNKTLSPAFEGNVMQPGALEWCIKLAREHPNWRLSVQQHKAWSIR